MPRRNRRPRRPGPPPPSPAVELIDAPDYEVLAWSLVVRGLRSQAICERPMPWTRTRRP